MDVLERLGKGEIKRQMDKGACFSASLSGTILMTSACEDRREWRPWLCLQGVACCFPPDGVEIERQSVPDPAWMSEAHSGTKAGPFGDDLTV